MPQECQEAFGMELHAVQWQMLVSETRHDFLGRPSEARRTRPPDIDSALRVPGWMTRLW